MGTDDRRNSASPAGSTALSAAELRARLCAAADHVQQLERERCALEEVRDSLTAKQRDLTRQRDEARQGLAALEQELAAARERLAQLEQELDSTEAEARLLERRCARALVSARELAREADAIAEELHDEGAGAGAGGEALLELGESIRRINHKLRFQQRKFADRERPAAERGELDQLLAELGGQDEGSG